MTTAYMPEAHLAPSGQPPSIHRTDALERGLERLHALFLAMSAKLIDALDEATPDPDLEPSLAGFGPDAGNTADLEEDTELEPDVDGEPLLGAPENHPSRRARGRLAGDQRNWAQGELDDREDDDEREPSLGAPITYASSDQRRWAQGAVDDREGGEDPGEDGGDDEHSLGRSESFRQGHEFGAPDLEPSLGSLGSGWAHFDQRLWAHGGDRLILDGEEQSEDEGAVEYEQVAAPEYQQAADAEIARRACAAVVSLELHR